MKRKISFIAIILIVPLLHCLCIPVSGERNKQNLLPIPDKLVVLTFDDGCKSDVEYVMPLLKKYGFKGTFFYTDAYLRKESLKGENYMTWEDVLKIHNAGFEIGNHTHNHPGVVGLLESELKEELEYIENRCKEYGIATPVSFCYPGFGFDQKAVQVLREKGYIFARRGVAPEYHDSDEGARGPLYEPTKDDPLLIYLVPVMQDRIGDLKIFSGRSNKGGKAKFLSLLFMASLITNIPG